MSDFDKVLDQRGMNSLKWEFTVRNGVPEQWDQTDPEQGEDQVLSMWVADMDFKTADPIVNALRKRVDRGIFGYAFITEVYLNAVQGWMKRRHGYPIEHDWIVPTIGIVPALSMIVRKFSSPGEKVLIQRPVYYPFSNAIKNNDRSVLCSPLKLENNRYQMDLEDLEEKAADPEVQLMILCSPHNPVGRAWSFEDIQKVGEICLKHQVLLVADEIHGDLIMPGHQFHSYGLLDPKLLENVIICTAPSKSFNLAGLKSSNLIIPNSEIRKRMKEEIKASGLFGINPFGIVATEAAYNEGEPWLEEAIGYIAKNFEFLDSFITSSIPSLKVLPLEATYLCWIDCRALGLSDQKLDQLMMEEAQIYMDEGHIFGPEGSGFIRLNLACPREIIEKALQRLKSSIEQLEPKID
jgi:cystathionine beta-lyase